MLGVRQQADNYAAEGTALCSLAEENSFVFLLNVPYEQSAHAVAGKACTLVLPDDTRLAATIGRALAVMNAESQSRPVMAYADAPFLPEGMNVKALLPVDETAEQMMILPKRTVQSDETLTARLENRDLGGVVGELRQAFDSGLTLPSGYNVSFGGAYSEQRQSFSELAMILGLATLLVLTVLMFLLREWRVSLAVLFVSLMGICGCLLALWVTGVPLNVSSYTGIIMIVGILAENSIFTVWQYKMNRRNGGSAEEAVDYAIALRIRPKLMTAIGAVLALMPLALGLGTGAQMQQPLAVAVIGGFVAGLPLLLLVLPALMRRIYLKREE